MANRDTLAHLLSQDLIDLRPSPLLDQSPRPHPSRPSWDRIEGMMLGLAIGDSLGATTEARLPAEREVEFGEIRDYLSFRDEQHVSDEAGMGAPSDDTQLAFWTLEQMIEDRGLDPSHVALRFSRDRIFGVGSAVQAFLQAVREGREWHLCGTPSAGNGALMRIAPVLIPHLRTPSPGLWADAALCAMITHNDTASLSACIAFVHMLWDLLAMDAAPEPDWWVNQYVRTASQLETDTPYSPRGGAFAGWSGSLSRFVAEKVPVAFSMDLSARQACDAWRSGAYLLETVPSVLYILMRHGHDFEEAVIRAVNDTRDNDTIAAIVGAAAGALHGARGIPARWRERLSGRTTDRDDGKVFSLLDQARRLWGPVA